MIQNFQDLKNAVQDRLDIYDVLSWYGVSLDRNNKSNCVLHGSEGQTCFHVNKTTKRFACYSCGAKGDALDFIREVENVDFIEAVYIAGLNLGLISAEERDNKRIEVKKHNNLQPIKIHNKQTVETTVVAKQEEPLIEEEIERNSIVYNALAYACGLELEDKEELLNNRYIREDRVYDYFTIKPNSSGLITKIIHLCSKYYKLEIEDIIKVPGFYMDDKGFVQLNNKMKTIAIRIRDSKGRTRMVQIRNKFAKEGDVKYYYLSSNNINGEKARMWVDVLYPNAKTWDKKTSSKELLDSGMATLFITEGKFKAEVLSDTFNCPVISIPGIKTYEDKVREEVLNINSMKQMKNLMIALDADMCDNIAVGESVIKMLEVELKDIQFRNTFVVVWDTKNGKGVDDVIINGSKDTLFKVKAQDFIRQYKQFMQDVADCDRRKEDDRKYMQFLFKKYVIEGEI